MDKIQQIIPKYKRKGFSKMKKIVLLWDTEIPSDFFVEKLIEESEKGSVKCEIQVYSIAEALENRIDADVVLLSPLICFEQIKIERLVRCPVDIIGIGAYALFDVKAILLKAFDAMRKKRI